MQNLRLTDSGKHLSFSKGPYKPGQTHSLLSSNLDALSMLGHGTAVSADPKGQVLRQVRLSQGIDPSVLASQSCISLAQLYELEEGLDTRFYSPSLRQQAARKVSGILGLNWDEPNLGTSLHSFTRKVVQMQRPAAIVTRSVSASPAPAEPVHGFEAALVDHKAAHSEPKFHGSEQSLAVLLSTASADSVDSLESTEHLRADLPHRQNSGAVTYTVIFFSLLLATGLLAAYFWPQETAQMWAWLQNSF